MKFIFVLILLVLCYMSCAHKEFDLDTTETWRRELELSVNGEMVRGSRTIPRASSYRIKLDLKQKLQRISLITCHRELIWRNVSSLDYTLVPVMFLENSGSCIMKIQAITDKGYAHNANIDFKANESLPTHSIYCNGDEFNNVQGAFMCQARVGSIQKLWFKDAVKPYNLEKCPNPIKISDFEWHITINQDFCLYVFKAVNKKDLFRFTSFGYNKVSVE